MDGDNRFVDFMQDGGSEMPFAIECVGNEFVIGKSAFESATKQLAPNAFTNIFDTCKELKTFRFAGREEQLNKLPFYAIKDYVDKILSDRFYGEVGNIDSNVSKLPLIFLFTPELDTDKKLFITSPFEKGGFQNMCSVSYHQLLLPIIVDSLPDKKKPEVVILVTVDKNDLIFQLYDSVSDKSLTDLIRIEGQGSDPRLKQAMDLIWEGLNNYNYQPREPEENVLREAALKFLNSNMRTVNDVLCMSDGSMQDYCLSRDELNISAIGEVVRLVSHHLNEALTNKGFSTQQSLVVLVGNAATDYFENIFGQMLFAYPVKKVLEKEKNLMLDRLLMLVKKADYKVSNLFSTSYRVIEKVNSPIENIPTLTDKRKVRIMMADIKAKLRGSDIEGAYTIYDDLKIWLGKRGFNAWNDELDNMMNGVERCVTKNLKPKEKIHTAPKVISNRPMNDSVVDLKKLRRELHREIADIKALVRTGKKDDAVYSLNELENRLHNDNVHEFDADFTALRKEYQLNVGTMEKTESHVSSAKKNISEAEKMLLQGQFAEAKRKFASEEGNSEMAQACSKLIRAKRNIASYLSGLDSVRRSHNETSKLNAIKELENCMALYRQYSLPTIDIEQLIEQYRII